MKGPRGSHSHFQAGLTCPSPAFPVWFFQALPAPVLWGVVGCGPSPSADKQGKTRGTVGTVALRLASPTAPKIHILGPQPVDLRVPDCPKYSEWPVRYPCIINVVCVCVCVISAFSSIVPPKGGYCVYPHFTDKEMGNREDN